MKKRLLTVLLAVILVMALGTVTAFADEPQAIPTNGGELSGEYKLTADTTVANQLTVAAGAEVTIDLNGCTLSLSANSAVIKNEGNLTITDTSETAAGKVSGSGGIINYGELTLESGTIESTDSNFCAVQFYEGSDTSTETGTFTMNGGKLSATSSSIGKMTKKFATINIFGGDAGSINLQPSFILTIGGEGVDHSKIHVGALKRLWNTDNVIINLYSGIIESLPSASKGITYNDNPTALIANNTQVPSGYHYKTITYNGQTYYQLEKNSEPVAHIGDTDYYYLPDAVAALGYGDTLVLDADFNVSDASEILKFTAPNVTLDLNGHNITSSAPSSPVACSGAASGTFTIKNSNDDEESSIASDSNQSYAIAAVSARSNTSVTVVIADNVTVGGVLLRSGARIADTAANRELLNYDGSMSNLYAVTIGGTKYIYGGGDLSAIGRDANADGMHEVTATLLGNSEEGITYKNANVALTVDLDSHKVSSVSNAVSIPNGADNVRLTVLNGTVSGFSSAASALAEDCTLTLENLKMTSGGDYGIAADGSKSNSLKLRLTNCTLTGTNDNMTTGIFFPVGGGELTIENSTITGYNTGVQAYAGTVTIKGDQTVITGSGVSEQNLDNGKPMDTGPIFDGAAVSIIDRNTDYGEFVDIKIEGGSFSTKTGSGDYGAVHVASEVEGTPGSFEEFVNTKEDGSKIVQVSGGTFTSSVSEYVVNSLQAELYSAADGTYTYYETPEEASDAAKPGDVVSSVTETAKYSVKVVYGNGTADTSVTVSSNATYILPTAPVREGYIFQGWNDETRTYPAGYSYTVTGNVTFTAVWKADRPVNLPTSHSIDLVVSDGGEAKLNLTNASEGATITVTVTPDEGFKLDYITVDGERLTGTSFTMPDHDVTVRVYFTDGAATLPFTDVASGAWYYDAVSYVYANGLMDGVSTTTFNPDGNMTRAMVWAILARIDGESVTGANWAESARAWAMANGVSDGENPDAAVTREMLATMLWRYAGSPASSYSLDAFSDAGSVSDWAGEAMAWAVEKGVITGVSATALDPAGTATRAQCATILMRYVAE